LFSPMKSSSVLCRWLYPLIFLASALPALAHHTPEGMEDVDEFADDAFLSAVQHPWTGIDHLLAALAVGLMALAWGRKLGGWSIVSFLASMAAGLCAGRLGLALPLQEQGLAASLLLCGGLILGVKWLSSRGLIAIVTAVGFWHGAAHGGEMSANASAFLVGSGLLIGTASISLVGWATHLLAKPRWISSLAGASVAAAGAWLLVLATR
jgi:urease accessory protein